MSYTKPSHQSGRGRLWGELRDGTAGPGVRIFTSLAVGLLLTGLACAIPYLLTLYVPSLRRSAGMPGTVRDDTVGVSFLVAGAIYLVALYWLWSKPLRYRGFWLAGAMTVGIWTLAGAVCLACDLLVGGDEEIGILGTLFVAGAASMLVWVEMWRQYGRGRPRFTGEGQFDVRCPGCGYSMVGLSESTCPECGERFTLDDLLARQGFEQGRDGPLLTEVGQTSARSGATITKDWE